METTYTKNFRLLRLLDDELTSSDCNITLHLEMKDTSDFELQGNILKAMSLWFDSFIDHSIAYFPGTSVDTTLFENITNNVIHAPEEPNDYHMCILLHSKLNAIGQGLVIVSKTEFSSDTSSGFKCAFSGETNDWLPTNEEWMGEHSFFKQPWWGRSDGSTFDVPYTQGDDVGHVQETIAINLIELVNKANVEKKVQPAEIIKPAFKLKLITNDE